MSNYEHDGKQKPSVTTIIGDCTDKSSGLTPWAANCVVEWIKQNCAGTSTLIYILDDEDLENARTHFRDVQQTALDVGSTVHSAIEEFLKTGKEPEIDSEEAKQGFLAFKTWAEANHYETISTEHTVYGPTWAGTLDWLVKLNGVITVVDFKTSKSYYPEYRIQSATYRYTNNIENRGVDTYAQANGVLMLDKLTGKPTYKDGSKKYYDDVDIFLTMVDLYFKRHPILRKKAGL